MIEDNKLSLQLQNDYQSIHENNQARKVELGIKVLCNGNWLFQNQYKLNLPPLISNCIDGFKLFYTVKESGKTHYGCLDKEIVR